MALRVINLKNNILYITNNVLIRSLKQFSQSTDDNDDCPPKKPAALHNSQITRFENGFRVATEDNCKPICTIGLWIETGSRWETKRLNGIAHFHEHMILKGIPDLETKLNKLGTQLSSYTTREITGFYSTCLPYQVPSMIEIFSDIVDYKNFDDSIIDIERETSLIEMKQNDKNYKKVVFDFLHSTAYQGTPLAQPTFGPTENVKKFTHLDITEYLTNNYQASRMVISVVGLVCHRELCDLVKESFCDFKATKSYLDPCRFTGSEIRYRDDSIPSIYAAIALEGCSLHATDYFPLTIAAAIIGIYNDEPFGINHPSKLVRVCAEDSLCDEFQSFHISYSDTGLWGIYFKGDPLQAWDMVYNIQNEWMKLCTMVTQSEVERAKNHLKTYFGNKLCGNEEQCISMGTQLMYSINNMELGEIYRKIDDVDKTRVQEVCMKYIYDQCPAVAVLGSVENFPDYNRLRSGMYWLRF